MNDLYKLSVCITMAGTETSVRCLLSELEGSHCRNHEVAASIPIKKKKKTEREREIAASTHVTIQKKERKFKKKA